MRPPPPTYQSGTRTAGSAYGRAGATRCWGGLGWGRGGRGEGGRCALFFSQQQLDFFLGGVASGCGPSSIVELSGSSVRSSSSSAATLWRAMMPCMLCTSCWNASLTCKLFFAEVSMSSNASFSASPCKATAGKGAV